MVDTLTYLHKGGRCSALALLGANVLGIRPSIKLENGKMNVGKKYVGKMHKILDKYVLDTLEEFNTPDNDLCFITYSSATDEMKDLVKATLKDHASFKKVKETIAGATVATHCGPNTLGIIYYNDGK
jgi:fatty acid-binding protein DegV